MFAGHVAVVRAVEDEGVVGKASAVEGVEDLAYHMVGEFDEGKIGGSGDAYAFFVEVEDVAVTAEAFDGGWLIGFDSGDVDKVVVMFEEVFGGNEGAVGDPNAGNGGKGTWVDATTFFGQVLAGGVDDALVGPVIGCIAMSSADNSVSALATEIAGIGFKGWTEWNGAAGKFGLPFANAAVFEAMMLIDSREMHASNEAGFVSGDAHVMRPCGDAGVEQVRVFPDAILRRETGGHKAAATGNA